MGPIPILNSEFFSEFFSPRNSSFLLFIVQRVFTWLRDADNSFVHFA